MAEYHNFSNISRDTAIQVNGGVINGDIQVSGNNTVPELQPSFFKTSNYESHKNINPHRVPQTCRWFLEHTTFQKWKSSNCNDLLWLSADPGCGKSVLSRALIDETLVSTEPFTLCYFFFKDNEEQNNTTGALCALLHQLFWRHRELLKKYALPAFEKCGEALKVDFYELWRIFIAAAIDSSAGKVVCILDALDECKPTDRNKLISHLEEFYSHSFHISNGRSKLKFLVTSRPYGDIENGFSRLMDDIPTIRLAGEDESDQISHEIGIVIEARVKEIAQRCGLNSHLQSSLQSRLNKIPNRTYLWLHLTLNEVELKIRKGKTEKKLLALISTLSSTVEEAYETILASCDKEEASKTLRIIVAARRPLTLSEIDIALEIEPNSMSYDDLDRQYEGRKESIRENCGLFINIVDSRVFLIHQTAREFLIQNCNHPSEPQKWKHSIDLQDAHQVLAKICVTYLLFREIKQLDVSATQQYKIEHKFLGYSADHWISHVQEAGINSIDWISRTAGLCDIGNINSCAWSRIYATSNFQEYLVSYSNQTAIWWAVVFGLVNETKFYLENSLDHNSQERIQEDVLIAAARNGHYGERLMEVLLARQGNELNITDQVVEAAAENRLSGKDIIALLLDRGGHEFIITEQVVKIAARNRESGKDIMALLLDRRGDEFNITERVVEAAADNPESGKDIVALLLDQRGYEFEIDNQVVKVAADNWKSGKDIIELLLDRRGDEFNITERVVKVAAENPESGKDIMALLLDRRGDEFNITERVVQVAAENWKSGKDIMALLLDRRGDEFKITERVVEAAARNLGSGKDVIELLLDRRGYEFKITEKVVKIAARNRESGKDIMVLLLDRRGYEFKITEQVVQVAARNLGSGKGIMALLLERRGDEFKITEQVVEAAAENPESGKDIIALLLDRRGDEFKITEQVVEAAADNWESGKDIMALLLDRRGDEFKITEQIVKAAACNMASGKDIIALLLDRRGYEFKITEQVVEAAAENLRIGKDIMALLLDRRGDDLKIRE